MSVLKYQFSFPVTTTDSQHIWIVSLHEACKILGKISGIPTDNEFLMHARGILREPASSVGELYFDRHSGRTYLSSGHGCIEYIADLLQVFLRHFDRPDIVRFEWSRCYGGGAAVVSKDRRLVETTEKTSRRLEETLLTLIAQE